MALRFFDLHCDTPYECFVKNQGFYVNNLAVSASKGKSFEEWKQIFAVWIKDDAENPFTLYKNILNNFKAILKAENGKPIPYFAVEGGSVIETDVDRLYELKKDGIKMITLTWNGENAIAGGVNSEKGLTSFGKTVIQEMNSLNLASDLSHLNEKSFYSALEYADFPLATHSNVKDIFNHKRNLKLDQIKVLFEKNGIMGICFYPEFLGEDVFESIYQNIFYLCDKGYEDNIAIGSDFDGAKMDKRLDDVSKVGAIYTFLEQKGLKRTLLDKIFYINANNFIAKLDKKD